MKKFKSLLAVLSAVAILSASSFNVLQVNAIDKMLGTDADGNEIWGGYYDELVGFDEDGNPIIESNIPDRSVPIEVVIGLDKNGDPIIITDYPGIPEMETLQIPGDINNSNSVDLTDLTELSLYLIGDKTFNDFEMFTADTNGDNEVNLADLAHLKQYIMSKDVKLG